MTSTSPQTSFAVVGTGWRSAFFLRLARAAPARFRVTGVVSRTPGRGDEFGARWGVRTFRTVEELLAAADAPDSMIASVPWAATPDVTRELVRLGMRVLAETPPAPDLAGLRALWDDVGASRRVQVAEQYLLMPAHAARLAVVRDGIGEPTSVQVSSTHLYHAVSMLRGLLGADCGPPSWRRAPSPLRSPISLAGVDHDRDVRLRGLHGPLPSRPRSWRVCCVARSVARGRSPCTERRRRPEPAMADSRQIGDSLSGLGVGTVAAVARALRLRPIAR